MHTFTKVVSASLGENFQCYYEVVLLEQKRLNSEKLCPKHVRYPLTDADEPESNCPENQFPENPLTFWKN